MKIYIGVPNEPSQDVQKSMRVKLIEKAADFAEEYIDEMKEEYLKLLKETTNK